MQFDEKYGGKDYEHRSDSMIGASERFFRSPPTDPFSMERGGAQWAAAERDRRANSPRTPLAHLPRSYQIVIEKASPPMPRKQISSPLPPRGPQHAHYHRSHRNSLSWDEESRRHMPVKPDALWLDYDRDSYSPPRVLPLLRTPPDPGSDLSVPTESDDLPGRYGNSTLQKFYQQVQHMFTAERISPSAPNSSNIAGASVVPRTSALAARQWERQAKSLEEAHRVGFFQHSDGQMHGRSFENSDCAACRNDALQQKMARYRGETLKPMMQRQRPIDGDDIVVPEADQIKKACVNLWSIRQALEESVDYNDGDDQRLLGGDDDGRNDGSPAMALQRSMDRSTDGGSAEGSSFESNTEPVLASDYLKQHRPSGPFLEPPRQGAEVKRQKY
uniref:Uncharacterized protein n=1 Tax=Plectus sambesii TaxID=2011161 RepID=A0A914XHE8_9BILA